MPTASKLLTGVLEKLSPGRWPWRSGAAWPAVMVPTRRTCWRTNGAKPAVPEVSAPEVASACESDSASLWLRSVPPGPELPPQPAARAAAVTIRERANRFIPDLRGKRVGAHGGPHGAVGRLGFRSTSRRSEVLRIIGVQFATYIGARQLGYCGVAEGPARHPARRGGASERGLVSGGPGAARERGLCCGQSGDWHSERRAGHVVHADRVAERHRGGLAPVLAADAELDTGTGLASALTPQSHQLAHASLVEYLKRVVLDEPVFE